MDQEHLQKEVEEILEDVLTKASLQEGALFILGLSSSEVIGKHIGKSSSQEIGELIVKRILEILSARGIHLALHGLCLSFKTSDGLFRAEMLPCIVAHFDKP